MAKNTPKRRKQFVAATQRYRTKKFANIVTLTDEEWKETLKAFDDKCVYCGAPWEQQDHLIPIPAGGGYTKENIVPSCANCNNSKGNKMPWEFTNNLGLIMLINGIKSEPVKSIKERKELSKKLHIDSNGWGFSPDW